MFFSCFATAEQRKNREIARQMSEAKENEISKVSIIIMGTGDSGKTTMRKQIVSVHGTKFEKESYRETFRRVILGNVIDGVLEVLVYLNQGEKISILKDRAREVKEVLPADVAELLLATIYEDPAFLKAVEDKSNTKLQIQDCFPVFMAELKNYPAWGGEGWVPTTDDCIRSRARTSGVLSDELKINGVDFTLYDVGGQRAYVWFFFITSSVAHNALKTEKEGNGCIVLMHALLQFLWRQFRNMIKCCLKIETKIVYKKHWNCFMNV